MTTESLNGIKQIIEAEKARCVHDHDGMIYITACDNIWNLIESGSRGVGDINGGVPATSTHQNIQASDEVVEKVVEAIISEIKRQNLSQEKDIGKTQYKVFAGVDGIMEVRLLAKAAIAAMGDASTRKDEEQIGNKSSSSPVDHTLTEEIAGFDDAPVPETLIGFVEEIVNAAGKYPYLNGTSIVADAYKALREHMNKFDESKIKEQLYPSEITDKEIPWYIRNMFHEKINSICEDEVHALDCADKIVALIEENWPKANKREYGNKLQEDIKLLRDALTYFKGFLIDGHDIATNALNKTDIEGDSNG